MLNVTSYGAVGNYNPATLSGTDDTASFVSAISAAQSSGQTLYIPAGNYKITGSIGSTTWAAGTGLRMFGDGNFVSNIFMIGTTSGSPGGGVLQLSGQNSYLRDLGFVCQNASNYLVEAGYATSSNNPSYIQISNCRFAAYSTADTFVSAIYCQELTQSSIDQCVIVSQAFNKQGARQWVGIGITFNSSTNNTVTNCKMEFMNYGVLVNQTTSPPTQGVLISSNLIFGASTAISVQGSQTAFVSAVNNILDFCAVGGVDATESTGSICNNYIAVDQSTKKGVAGIFLSGCSRMTIIGNALNEYSGASGQNVSAIGLLSSCVNNVISGNTLVYFNTGIYIDNTCSATVVTSNSSQAAYGAFIANSSSTTSLNNNTTS